MQSAPRTTAAARPMVKGPLSLRGVFGVLLRRVIEADGRARQKAQLRALSDTHLRDMGLTRAQAEAAFSLPSRA